MVCVDETVSSFMEDSRKLVYLGHRHFLVEGHRYRSKKFYTFFDGKAELHSAPAKRDGHYIFRMVRTIQVSYGKVTKDGKKKIEIRHQSKAYHSRNSPSYLPYWGDLEYRHAIDGMHLKKNVFGNTIGLLLETSAKTKNILKLHQDLVAMKIRKDLHPIDIGNGR